MTGFEPALPAWRAGVLPLNYTRAKMEEGDIAVHAPPGVEPGDKRTRTTLAHLRGTVPRGLHCCRLFRAATRIAVLHYSCRFRFVTNLRFSDTHPARPSGTAHIASALGWNIGFGTPPRLALSPTLVRFAAYQAAAIRIADTNPASRASSTACGVCTGGGTRTHDQGHSTAISLLAVKLYRLSYPGIMPVFPGCPLVYSDCRVVRRHTLRRSHFLHGF